jgi:hypothetical protein
MLSNPDLRIYSGNCSIVFTISGCMPLQPHYPAPLLLIPARPVRDRYVYFYPASLFSCSKNPFSGQQVKRRLFSIASYRQKQLIQIFYNSNQSHHIQFGATIQIVFQLAQGY